MDIPVITWRTTKTATGYEWEVYSFGYQMQQIRLAHGLVKTRAIATRCARQMTRWYKREQAKTLVTA